MLQQHNFTHHGHAFTIEAEGWQTEEAAYTAIFDLHIWTLQLGPHAIAQLHDALTQETEALVHEATYDRAAAPLVDVRVAQRRAMRVGLQGHKVYGLQPTILIDAA
jgi:hypothetical protein